MKCNIYWKRLLLASSTRFVLGANDDHIKIGHLFVPLLLIFFLIWTHSNRLLGGSVFVSFCIILLFFKCCSKWILLLYVYILFYEAQAHPFHLVSPHSYRILNQRIKTDCIRLHLWICLFGTLYAHITILQSHLEFEIRNSKAKGSLASTMAFHFNLNLEMFFYDSSEIIFISLFVDSFNIDHRLMNKC